MALARQTTTISDLLFDRRVRLLVSTIVPADFEQQVETLYEITDLRVRFTVKKNLRKEPNTAEIKVSNLAPESRAALQRKGMRVVLQAGHADTIATIYVGDSRDVEPPLHESTGEVVTTIQCGTSERAYLHARVSESFRAGVHLADIAVNLARAMGLDSTAAEAKIRAESGRVYAAGHAAHGRASRELERVLRANGFEWSVQDGQLQVRRPGEPAVKRIVELSPETGLVGSAEFGSPEKKGGKPTIKIRAILQPDLQPGGRVVVTSQRQAGTLLIKKLQHSGDTASNEWYSDIECEQEKAA